MTDHDKQRQMDRISEARTRLVARIPFFGHLALKLRPRICRPEDQVSTAAVAPDGTLIFNEAFLAKLTDPELCFVLAHEVFHPALLYFQRLQNRIPKLWNVAHDYAINLIIKEMSAQDDTIKVRDDALLDESFRNMSAEEIYDLLLQDAVTVELVTGHEQGQEGGQGDGKGKGKGKNPLQDPLFGDARPDLGDSEDGQKAQKGDKGAQNRMETDWKISLVAASQRHEQEKGRGSLPAGLVRLIDDLVNPKVDWLEQLRRYIGEKGRRQDYTYSRPARRSESIGQYMPSIKRFGVDDICVMMDTSGSISMQMLKEGVSEVQGICEDLGVGVRALIIDADVHDDVECEDALDMVDHLSGGGGSDFRPGFDRLRKTGYTGIVIAFTDGDIGVPAEKPEHLRDVLWVIYEGCHSPCSWGETIMIPREGDKR